MSYRFEQEEAIADGIKRIALEKIDEALSELTSPSDDADEATHEARKCFKKVRAVLRLVRDTVGNQVYRAENLCYRDAGRQLSAVRDSAVMIETLDALAEHIDEQRDKDAFGHIREKLVESHDAVRQRIVAEENAMDHVATVIQDARSRVTDWPVEDNGFAVLRGGLERVYKRGRKALGDARAEPTIKSLHELRKRAKRLWYHMRILGPSWPELLGELADQIHTVSDELGNDHDLALLSRFVQDRKGEMLSDQTEAAGLLAVIAEWRNELQAGIWSTAERVYVEKPKDFVKRIAGYWRVWRA
jgi:CHAD domain-containing protein